MTSVVSLYVIFCLCYVNHHTEYRYGLQEKQQIPGYYICLKWNNKINVVKIIHETNMKEHHDTLQTSYKINHYVLPV